MLSASDPSYLYLQTIAISPKWPGTHLRNKCSWGAYPGGTCKSDWWRDRQCILLATSYLRPDTTAYSGEIGFQNATMMI